MRKNYTKTDNSDFFKTWTQDMAYILGFYCGDGCITKRKGYDKYRLVFSIHEKDIEIIEFIKKNINPDRKILKTKSFQKSGKITPYVKIIIDSTEICKDILNMGFQLRKTYNTFLPKIPEDYKPDFLRGLFDADGCVENEGKRKRARIACKDKNFLEELKDSTVKCGNIYPGHSTWDWTFGSQKDIFTFRNYIYNGNFCLKRKYDIFQEISFKEVETFTAFNETKTIQDWLDDERCNIKDPASIRRRSKLYSKFLTNEQILSLPSKEIWNHIPRYIVLDKDNNLYIAPNEKSIIKKFGEICKSDCLQTKNGLSIRNIKKGYEEWLSIKRTHKTYGPHKMEDFKLMWDEEKLKNAIVIG